MSRRDRYYPRIIAWLRIALPLAALGILSTLFLLSRNIDPTGSIPFTEGEIEERLRDQRITAPNFAGATPRGDMITFTATSAQPDAQNAKRLLSDDLSAKITLPDGDLIEFRADRGIVDMQSQRAQLIGGAVITSSAGYRVTTDELDAALTELDANTKGPVQAQGPPGTFSAGRMQLQSDSATGNAQLLFTDGVKLLYDPSN